MSRGAVAVVVGICVAGACWSLSCAARVPLRRLAQVRALLVDPTPGRPAERTDGVASWRAVARARRAAEDVVGRRFGASLHLIGSDARTAAGSVLAAGVLGVLSGAIGVGVLVVSGTLPAHPLWLIAVAGVGAVGARIAWVDLRSRTERRMVEVRRAVAEMVQLLAVGLTGDQSVEEALWFAVDVGDSAVAAEFATHLRAGAARGMAVWETIAELGVLYDHHELVELADAVERQGLYGVGVADTVGRLATTIRERMLADVEREADRANAALAGPTLAFVLSTVLFLGYPLAVRIGSAFGG